MVANIMAGLYILLSLSFVILVWVSIIEIVRAWVVMVKNWRRRRAVDRRIIAQAKAAGVWENPKCMGGRALELYASQRYGLKRMVGESDFELRHRCLIAADEENKRGGDPE